MLGVDVIGGLELFWDCEGLESLGGLAVSGWGEKRVRLRHGWVTLWRVRNVAESPHLVHPVEIILYRYGEVVLCMYNICFNMFKYGQLVLQPL